MNENEICGYVASALVLATFSMTSMRALRTTAIASNVAFIAYASLTQLNPVLALHVTLLPLNIFRLARSEGWSSSNLRQGFAGLADACDARLKLSRR